MRILQVIQRYYPFEGGSERYFRSLAERFAADGHDVQVITTDAWDLEYFWDNTRRRVEEATGRHQGVAIRRLPVAHLPFASVSHRAIRRLMAESSRFDFAGQTRLLEYGSRFGPWLPQLEAALRQTDRVDVIHSANIAFESMIAASARFAAERGIPHIVTPFLHLGEGEHSRVRRYYTMPHQMQLLRRADAVMVLTQIEAEFLARAGVSEERLAIAGAGIDVGQVIGGDGQAARERIGVAGPIVLALGAAAFDKGTVHLVQAVAQLASQGHSVDLVIAGPILGEFTAFLAGLPPSETTRIHVLGFVSEAEKRDLLAAADIVALPSRTESFGLVFLEAWANGKPVIGARAGAIPAVVSDGIDGILVDFGDVAALADAILALSSDRALRERLGQAGARNVLGETDWFNRVRAIYDRVLGVELATPTLSSIR